MTKSVSHQKSIKTSNKENHFQLVETIEIKFNFMNPFRSNSLQKQQFFNFPFRKSF